ncbi:unnamed protein product, partial [Acanthoscelides obtectus]
TKWFGNEVHLWKNTPQTPPSGKRIGAAVYNVEVNEFIVDEIEGVTLWTFSAGEMEIKRDKRALGVGGGRKGPKSGAFVLPTADKFSEELEAKENLVSTSSSSLLELSSIAFCFLMTFSFLEPEGGVTDLQQLFVVSSTRMSQLLIEKDRLIEQLVNENTRFQDQLNLLSTNITEKETVVDALKKLNTRIDIIEKSSMTSTSYSQIVKKTYATKRKEIPLKSIFRLVDISTVLDAIRSIKSNSSGFPVNMPPKQRERANWTTEQLQAAINSVKGGAAQHYNIPRRTLRNHLKSGVLNKKIGRSSSNTITESSGSESTDSEEDIPLSAIKRSIQQKVSDKVKYSSETPRKTNDSIQIQTESQDLNKSFNELLPTPELFSLKENKVPKRKSINYKAQLVTKDQFSSTTSKCEHKRKIRKQPTASSSKILVENCSESNTPKSESWYCCVCQKSEQLDMVVLCDMWPLESSPEAVRVQNFDQVPVAPEDCDMVRVPDIFR